MCCFIHFWEEPVLWMVLQYIGSKEHVLENFENLHCDPDLPLRVKLPVFNLWFAKIDVINRSMVKSNVG